MKIKNLKEQINKIPDGATLYVENDYIYNDSPLVLVERIIKKIIKESRISYDFNTNMVKGYTFPVLTHMVEVNWDDSDKCDPIDISALKLNIKVIDDLEKPNEEEFLKNIEVTLEIK